MIVKLLVVCTELWVCLSGGRALRGLYRTLDLSGEREALNGLYPTLDLSVW